MTAVYKVFVRVLAGEFYRINAGFFIVVAGVFFGFLSGREHVALAQAFVSSYYLLLIPFSFWVIYLFKVLQFNRRQVARPENAFMVWSSVIGQRLWLACAWVALCQLLLPLAYGAFLISMALSSQMPSRILPIVIVMAVMLSTVAWRIRQQIVHASREANISSGKAWMDRHFTRPFVLIFPEWLTRQQPVLVVGTKIFASVVIVATCRLYLFDTYDVRLLGMGCTIAFASNLMIVFQYHLFENLHFSVLRSFPIPLSMRLIDFILSMAAITSLEFGCVIKYMPVQLTLWDAGQIIFLAISIYVAVYGLLFVDNPGVDIFMRRLFIATLLTIILILFKVPLWMMASILLVTGATSFFGYYYRFEFRGEKNQK